MVETGSGINLHLKYGLVVLVAVNWTSLMGPSFQIWWVPKSQDLFPLDRETYLILVNLSIACTRNHLRP